jgi:hypothetical protein
LPASSSSSSVLTFSSQWIEFFWDTCWWKFEVFF